MVRAQSMTYKNSFDLSGGATYDDALYIGSQVASPNGLIFSPDGTKVYTLNVSSDVVHQYSLSTAFDVTSGTYDGASSSISSEEDNAQAMAFNGDGTKMFVIGNANDDVFSYSLTSAYDVTSGITYDNVSFDVTSQAPTPVDMHFSPDGMKMFILSHPSIHQYSLTSAYTISSGVTYDGAFNASTLVSGETFVDMSFGLDGKKLFLAGTTSDDIFQFSVSSAYDVLSTLSYDEYKFDFTSEELTPTGMRFNNDGSRFYVLGTTYDQIRQYDLNSGVIAETSENDGNVAGAGGFQITGDQFVNGGSTLTQDVHYSISNLPAGLSTSITVGESGNYGVLNVSGTATSHQEADDIASLTFTFTSSAFVGEDAGAVTNAVAASSGISVDFDENNPTISYDLTYDLSTDFTNQGYHSVSTQESTPQGVSFSNDGYTMFVVGATSRAVQQYSCKNPFDISNVIHIGSFSVITEETQPTDLTFNDDGTKMFVIGYAKVNQYSLTTPFDITAGVSSDGSSFAVGGQESQPTGLAFSEDGLTMFIVGQNGDEVNQYALTDAYDITSGVSVDGSPVSVPEAGLYPGGLDFSADGTKMFVAAGTKGEVYMYDLASAFDINSGVTYSGVMADLSADYTHIVGITWANDGKSFYTVEYSYDRVHQYDLTSSGFIETTGNQGEVEGQMPFTLVDDYFENAGGSLVETTHFTISNKPAGLTASIAVDADGRGGVLTFTGSASSHQNSNSVSSMNVTFTDAAFVNSAAADVAGGVSASTDVAIDFDDNNKAIKYGYAFELLNASFNKGGGFSGSNHKDFAFNDDGSKMYVLWSDSRVYELVLGVSYDIGSMTLTGNNISVSSEETAPTDIAFSADGMKMFIVGVNYDSVVQYSMTSAYDVTSATHDGSYFIGNEETTPYSLSFNSSGTKMYVTGWDSDKVHQYTLTAPFSITSGVTNDGDPFNIKFEDDYATDIAFGNSGYYLYMIGKGSDQVHLYELETAYDITSLISLEQTFDVSAQQTEPRGVQVSPDGSSLYVFGTSGSEIVQYDLSAGGFVESADNDGSVDGELIIRALDETFTNAGSTLTSSTDYDLGNIPIGLTPVLTVSADGTTATLTLIGNASDHQSVDDVSSIGFDFAASAFSGGTDADVANANKAESGIGVYFEDNFSFISYGYAYSLENGAEFSTYFNPSDDDTNIQGLAFNDDGSKMYVVGNTGNAILQYTLGSPYEIGGAITLEGSF